MCDSRLLFGAKKVGDLLKVKVVIDKFGRIDVLTHANKLPPGSYNTVSHLQ